MLEVCAMPSPRSIGYLGVEVLSAHGLSFEASVCTVICFIVASLGISRKHIFHDVWLARTDSVEEMVHRCHGNVENECWDEIFRGFNNSGWPVHISEARG